MLARRRGQAELQRPHDPRDEVDDPWTSHVRCRACDRSCIAVEMDRDSSAGHRAICPEHAQLNPACSRAVRAEATGVG